MNSRPGWKRIFGKLNSETLRETKDKFRLGADAMEGVTASPRSQTGISVPVAEALRESGKLFRLAFEHAPVAMAFVGTDFRFLKVNATFCRLFGYAEEELQSLTFVDLTHPEDVAKGVELSQQLARGEIPGFKLGKRYRTRSGETIWGEVTVAAVCDSDEPSLFGLVIIENITERKQAEEALRESEDRFRILADTAPVMVWMSGTDEFFDFFNLGWLAFTGRTPEQESGQGWFEGVHPDDVARCRQTCLAAFQAQEDFEMVHRLRRFDGEYRWVLNTGVPRFTPSGRFAGYIGSCLDITERQRTGEALRSALEFRERVMEAATNAIAVLDSEGKFILANCRAAEITGYTVEDLIGRSFHTLLPETELARVSEQVQATLTQCVQVLQFETEVLRKDGATRTISFSLEPLVLEGGQPGLVGTAEDITERKRAEASLLKEKRLSEATIASLPGVFYLFDETGKFLLWNQDLERVSGYSAAEIAQMHPLDLFAGDDRQLIAERIQEVFARGQATAEAHLIAKDGRQTPFYFTGRHVVLDHLSCLVGMGIDLTERRRAEAVLRESEDRNRDLIENSGVIIGMHDLEGNILSVNQSFVSVAGYERAEELLSLRISDLLADDVRRFFPVYLKKIRSKGYARGLMKIVTPGGEERTLEYDNSVRREGPSTPIVRCFARDVTERKRAVDALKESEVQLRTLGDNLPNGAIYQIVRKPDGRTYFQYISAGIERLLGVTAEEAMRDFCVVDDLLVVEEDRPRALAAINESIRSLSTFDIEVRSRTRQGQVKWIRFRSTPRRLPNGGTLCDGVMIDVTDVRRKLEALLQTVGAIIWEGWEGEEDTDARTFRFTFVSQQAVALLGYPVKDWLEQPTFWFDHLHPEDRRRVLTERRQAIAARRDYELEYRMMANDGRTVWLRGIVKVAYGNDQRLKLRGITVDVTEQKQAEAALRESEELFRTLAETTSAAIYIVRENRCVYANPTAEARSGYTRDELLAMDVWDLVHPEVRERAHERFQTLHKERLIPLHYETKGLAKSGQERWVEVSATPITFQGQPSLLVTTFDVTERKRAEDA
ncbi:MAG: PAS domain S-box protein, partial [Blastocatellia bacterium]